jgi:hypothetical protein
MSKVSQYLTIYIISIVVTCIILVTLIYVADPYSLLGSRLMSSLTQKKYFVSAYERISKPTIVCRDRPEAVILGTSRAAVGLRPATLVGHIGRTYNFSLNGAYLNEIDAALRVAARCGVKSILYGVDFFTFTEKTEERARQIRIMNDEFSWQKAYVFAQNILSLRAIMDSLSTVLSNFQNDAPSHNETGAFVNYDPVNVPFQAPAREQRQTLPEAYEIFDAMLNFAQENGIDIKMFISPVYRSHDRDDQVYADWLSNVIEISKQHDIPIYNVAGRSEFSANRSDFHDASHYKMEVGDRIIGAIYGPPKDKVKTH